MGNLTLQIDNKLVGPLAHAKTLESLERAIASSTTLDEADASILAIPILATYRGGSHIAVHPTHQGRFAHGSQRLAIITAKAPT